jgi:hypothetical protein
MLNMWGASSRTQGKTCGCRRTAAWMGVHKKAGPSRDAETQSTTTGKTRPLWMHVKLCGISGGNLRAYLGEL